MRTKNEKELITNEINEDVGPASYNPEFNKIKISSEKFSIGKEERQKEKNFFNRNPAGADYNPQIDTIKIVAPSRGFTKAQRNNYMDEKKTPGPGDY